MTLRKTIKRFLYGRMPGMAGSFPYYGVTVHFPPGSVAFDAAVDQGIFEKENVQTLIEFAAGGSTVFDVGGNLGLMAIPILRGKPDVKVVSFEPSPNTLPFLTKTIAGSGFGDRWRVIGKAVADRPGTIEFFAAEQANSFYDGLKSTGRGGTTRSLSVLATTLDETWIELGRPKVSIIKIDVEGAETRVLAGGKELLSAMKPHVLLEWNATNLAAHNVEPNHILELARSVGYRAYAVPGGTPIDDPVTLRIQMHATETFLLSPKSQE